MLKYLVLFIAFCCVTYQACPERKTPCVSTALQRSSEEHMPVPLVRNQPGIPVCTICCCTALAGRSPESDSLEVWGNLSIAIYLDGRIIWANNLRQGKGPYFEGRIPPEKIRTFLDDIEKHKFFSTYKKSLICGKHNSSLYGIVIYDGIRRLGLYFDEESVEMTIWDCWLQAKGKKTCLSDLSESEIKKLQQEFSVYLSGLTEADKAKIVHEHFPAKWSQFRKDWLTINKYASDLIPKSGNHVKGKVELEINYIEITGEK